MDWGGSSAPGFETRSSDEPPTFGITNGTVISQLEQSRPTQPKGFHLHIFLTFRGFSQIYS